MSDALAARAIAVVDLGFGDAGKGLVTDFLVRITGARTVVRFNGGAQAGHNVVAPDGRHHTFSQIGSGSFVPGVRTHLAEPVVVHPTALLVEATRLAAIGVADALARLTVSERAKVVTPYHQAAGRLRELARGRGRHGSCGVGVGEVMRDALAYPDEALRAGHLAGRPALRARLLRVRDRVRTSIAEELDAARASGDGAALREAGVFDDARLADAWIDATRPFVQQVPLRGDGALGAALQGRIVFEGAQGVLLDAAYGFHPFTTWSDCTFGGADALLRDLGTGERAARVGVVRSYAHRHGPGPLPTESRELTAAIDEPHNVDGPWQGPFRAGWTDLVLARYARTVCGPIDALAITHADAIDRQAPWRIATAYEVEGAVSGSPAPRITEWSVADPGDLAGREDRSTALRASRPVLELIRPASRGGLEGEVVDRLGDACRATVRLVSRGPRSTDVELRAGR